MSAQTTAGVGRPAASAQRRPRIALWAPFLWLTLFFAAPFLIVLKVSLSSQQDGRPPYAPVFDLAAGPFALLQKAREFTGQSYVAVFSDSLYLEAFASSIAMAFAATLIALAIAYPLAYAMARAPRHWRAILVVMAIAPFWTSFLIRVYAWITILRDEGLLNHALLSLGLISQPIHIYATYWAVLIGIVYSYLPFIILPIYTAFEKQDEALVEAAKDLGASPLRAFLAITLPLSMRGVLAGCLLVFIPAVGEFVIPDLLGSSEVLMIGRTLWDEFSTARNWPGAAAVAVVMLAFLAVPIVLYQRAQSVREGGRP